MSHNTYGSIQEYKRSVVEREKCLNSSPLLLQRLRFFLTQHEISQHEVFSEETTDCEIHKMNRKCSAHCFHGYGKTDKLPGAEEIFLKEGKIIWALYHRSVERFAVSVDNDKALNSFNKGNGLLWQMSINLQATTKIVCTVKDHSVFISPEIISDIADMTLKNTTLSYYKYLIYASRAAWSRTPIKFIKRTFIRFGLNGGKVQSQWT